MKLITAWPLGFLLAYVLLMVTSQPSAVRLSCTERSLAQPISDFYGIYEREGSDNRYRKSGPTFKILYRSLKSGRWAFTSTENGVANSQGTIVSEGATSGSPEGLLYMYYTGSEWKREPCLIIDDISHDVSASFLEVIETSIAAMSPGTVSSHEEVASVAPAKVVAAVPQDNVVEISSESGRLDAHRLELFDPKSMAGTESLLTIMTRFIANFSFVSQYVFF